MQLVKLTTVDFNDHRDARTVHLDPKDVSWITTYTGPDDECTRLTLKNGTELTVYEPLAEVALLIDGSPQALRKVERSRERRSSMFQAIRDAWKMFGGDTQVVEQDGSKVPTLRLKKYSDGSHKFIKLYVTLSVTEEDDVFSLYGLEDDVSLVLFYSAHKGRLSGYTRETVDRLVERYSTTHPGSKNRMVASLGDAKLVCQLRDRDEPRMQMVPTERKIRDASGKDITVCRIEEVPAAQD